MILENRYLRYYSIFALLFLASNFTYFSMSPRVISVFSMLEPGGILIFPFTFFFSDIINEVYGYKLARQLVWISVLCLGFFVVCSYLSMLIPSASIDPNGKAFQQVFNNYPKAFAGIGTATVVSFLSNNYILAKLKILAKGRYYWLRSIISTSIGHIIFSFIFAAIFYAGRMPATDIIKMTIYIYFWKIAFEIILTPFSAYIASWLKQKEGVDVYDYYTNFTPFSLSV
jgi:uncharacterized integral membrane protein (TIGR00697 family)